MKIAIAGATGNIGSATARQVVLNGAIPILLGQNIDRLNQLNITGAIAKVADLGDMAEMIKATHDADALLWLVPPVAAAPSLKEWYDKITTAGIAAVQQNDIKRVVLISSLGVSTKPNLGTISYCGIMEEAFDKLGVNVLALRPGYFMENFLLQAQSIKEKGEFSFTYDALHDIPFVSTEDVGNIAAKYLLDENWAGHWKLNLMGPENITLSDVALRLSSLTDKPVRYRQESFEEIKFRLNNWGVGETMQNELIDLFKALGDPNGAYATPRTPEAYTATSFDEFVINKLMPVLI